MRGLLLYENEMEAKGLIHLLWSKHGIGKLDSKDLYSTEYDEALQSYDFVMMQFNTERAEKVYQEHFAGLFSVLEETVTIFISNNVENSFWNDKFDHIVYRSNIRELIKIVMKVKKRKKRSDCLPSWVSDRLIVKSHKNHYFIRYHDICFFEKRNKNLLVHTLQETITTRENLSNIEDSLPENFVKVHRAYIINLDHISRIENIGNRSYQIEFYDSEETAFMSRYKAETIFNMLD